MEQPNVVRERTSWGAGDNRNRKEQGLACGTVYVSEVAAIDERQERLMGMQSEGVLALSSVRRQIVGTTIDSLLT